MGYRDNSISDLMGETITEIKKEDDYELWFTCESGKVFKMYHEQDCCEGVIIDDISGSLDDLIGSTILQAEEVGNDAPARSEYTESFTWTFYKIATVKGYVTIKWYGESNGYYSESVDFILTNPQSINN